MFDGKHFGLVDVAIAEEIAKHLDNGEPKPKLSDSLRRGLARITKRDEAAQAQPEAHKPAGQEPIKNWV
jgi:hypothetical protein